VKWWLIATRAPVLLAASCPGACQIIGTKGTPQAHSSKGKAIIIQRIVISCFASA
jgi:hypothetical protein